jgi:hypothetical protein
VRNFNSVVRSRVRVGIMCIITVVGRDVREKRPSLAGAVPPATRASGAGLGGRIATRLHGDNGSR